jgi:hypothetical protein
MVHFSHCPRDGALACVGRDGLPGAALKAGQGAWMRTRCMEGCAQVVETRSKGIGRKGSWQKHSPEKVLCALPLCVGL